MTESEKKTGLTFVKILFDNKPIHALIDTGSTVSLAGQKLFTLFPELKQHLQNDNGIAASVCSSVINFDGKIPFTFELAGQTFTIMLKYLENMPYAVLLGADFLHNVGAQLNFDQGIMSVQKKFDVGAKYNCLLEPGKESVVMCVLPHTQLKDVSALISVSAAVDSDLIVMPSFVQLSDNNQTVPLSVINQTNKTIILDPGDIVATLQLLDGQDEVYEAMVDYNEEMPDQENEILREDFEKLFNWEDTILDTEQQIQLQDLLWEYRDLFQKPGQDLGHTDILNHDIKLVPDSKVFRSQPYRSNPKIREEISKQVQDMLHKGIISPSNSPYSSPVVMVRKPDGSFRFCVDFRKLNSITVDDCHPLVRVDDSLESLGSADAKYFSTMDLESGFWQLPLEQDTKPLSAFITHDGLYQFERMPFGLKNAPATFSRLMATVLRGLIWKICLVYLDDVIVFSKDFSQHLERLSLVFDRLSKANLRLKPKKCSFGRKKIRFLGHLVSASGIEPLPETCESVKDFPRPSTVREVRSFIGLTSYYRRFIPQFSRKSKPLTDLTRRDVAFIWDDKCETAFRTLKEALTSPPILAYPKYQDPYILTVDSSGDSCGMVLSQIQDGVERVISYGAKKYSPAEKNYGITEKEALACILGVKHYEPYLKGTTFKIVTDHAALKWLLDQKKTSGRIARWIAYLQQFDYTVEHKPGKRLGNADGLSRQTNYLERKDQELQELDDVILPPLKDTYTCEKPSNQPVVPAEKPSQEIDLVNAVKEVPEPHTRETANPRDSNISETQEPLAAKTENAWINRPKAPEDVRPNLTATDLRQMQKADPNVEPILAYLEDDVLPSNMRDSKRLAVSAQNFEIIEGVLYHLWYPDGLGVNGRKIIQLVVPGVLVHDVLTSAHGDVPAGHFGIKKTYHTIKLNFYWKGMMRDVKNWVKSCHQCSAAKAPTRPYISPLLPQPVRGIGEVWSMDILGPLPKCHSGSKYMLVFMESMSKWAEVFPLVETKAHIIARYFVEEIVYRFGAPTYLKSDMGSNMIAKVVNEAALLLGTKRLVTSPYRPQTNSEVERFNYSLIKQLQGYVDASTKDWARFLRPICFAYNVSTCVDSTHYQPFYLMFGRTPRTPFSTTLPDPPDVTNEDNKEFIKDLVLGLQYAHDRARENMEYHKAKMKEQYDKKVYTVDYQVGQRVWVYFPVVKAGEARKLKKKFSGPFIITEKVRPKNFKVVRGHDLKPLKNMVHVDRLKPYVDRQVVPPSPEELENVLGEESEVDEIDDLWEEDREIEEPVNPLDLQEGDINDNNNTEPTHAVEPGNTDKNDNEVDESVDTLETAESETSGRNLRRSRRKRKSVKPILYSPSDSEENESEYEINQIIKGRYTKDGKIEYLIDWKGYPKEARTYEPYDNLNDFAKKYVNEHNVPIVGKPTDKQQ